MIDGVTDPLHAATHSPARNDARAGERSRPADQHPDPTDTVDLSEAAQEQIERGESGLLRTELVERVRAEIAAGTYLSDDKLDAAVGRLHETMFTAA